MEDFLYLKRLKLVNPVSTTILEQLEMPNQNQSAAKGGIHRSTWVTIDMGVSLPGQVSIKTMGTVIITLDDVQELEAKEEEEESILALLGIIGTFLNLFVIVFVYIYTTV